MIEDQQEQQQPHIDLLETDIAADRIETTDQYDESINTDDDISAEEDAEEDEEIEIKFHNVNEFEDEEEEEETAANTAPENRADEVPPPESDADDDFAGMRTRSGRRSQSYDFESKFPDIYG